MAIYARCEIRLLAGPVLGRLVIAGPTPLEVGQTAMSGSLIIAAFESLEAAQDWASQEPYLTAGVYSHVDIKPFIKVLPSA